MAKAWWTSQRSKAKRICGVFNLLSISISIREAAMFCLTCIGQIFATLSLIYWPACLIIVCMYLINTRVFQKKKKRIVHKPKKGGLRSSAKSHDVSWIGWTMNIVMQPLQMNFNSQAFVLFHNPAISFHVRPMKNWFVINTSNREFISKNFTMTVATLLSLKVIVKVRLQCLRMSVSLDNTDDDDNLDKTTVVMNNIIWSTIVPREIC